MAGIRIDALPSTLLPSLEHEFPAMKDGLSVKLAIQQVSDLVSGILGPDIEASLKYVRALGASEDLNAIKEPGIYTQNNDAGATGGTNYPENRAGMLVVLPGGTSANVRTVQLYFARFTTQRLHWRMESAANTWYGWVNAFNWDAPLVSQGVAEAGTSTDGNVKWSPERVAQAIIALSGSVGIGQTWQNVKASRAINTAYQNTTGKPIQLSISASISSDMDFQVSADGSTWLSAQYLDNFGVNQVSHIIPVGWRYRLNAASGATITYWLELR